MPWPEWVDEAESVGGAWGYLVGGIPGCLCASFWNSFILSLGREVAFKCKDKVREVDILY